MVLHQEKKTEDLILEWTVYRKNMSEHQASSVLRFKGCYMFRFRILCATLTGRTLVISDIRPNGSDDNPQPGLRGTSSQIITFKDFEASFLRLIEKITNGCEITINETGFSSKILLICRNENRLQTWNNYRWNEHSWLWKCEEYRVFFRANNMLGSIQQTSKLIFVLLIIRELILL